MAIKFCSISSGSTGNCHYLGTDNTKILVDAGLSGKKIQSLLSQIEVEGKDIDGILVTHEHTDHIKAVGILSRRFDIPVYTNEKTWSKLVNSIGDIKDKNIKVIKNNSDFTIKDLNITSFQVFHDAIDPIGYTFSHDNKKVAILTDTGEVDSSILKQLDNSDLIMLESNHDVNMLKIGSYPQFLKQRVLSKVGHLSNEDAAKVLKSIKIKESTKLILGHLSGENNFPELAYETVTGILKEADMGFLKPEISLKEKLTKVYKI